MGMAMVLDAETLYLRAFAKTYHNEIAFDAVTESQMRASRIWLPALHHALKTGVVTGSERNEEGWTWIVSGKTCDDEELEITLEVICDRYHMCVQNIVKVERKNR